MNDFPRVVVVGTGFGRVYLSAFRSSNFEFELAGILARGSERSRACARCYGVPLWTHPNQVAADVDIACVVVGSALNGGQGQYISECLMQQGIHVLQEHPLHHDELIKCLRRARQCEVNYILNTHYVHIKPVRRFVAAVQELVRKQRPLFIDAASGFQTVYSLFDIIGRALGGLRPWAFGELSQLTAPVRDLSRSGPPAFRSIDGLVAGVPVSLSVQNQLAPSDPDNHAHLFHRITIVTASGNITLLNTHGPVIWCPRPHMPADAKATVLLEDSVAPHLDLPTAELIGPVQTPSYRQILSSVWPDGVRHALREMRQSILNRNPSKSTGQYYLTLANVWSDAMSRFGPVELVRGATPDIFGAAPLAAAASTVDRDTIE